jgi:hypothetical protein
MSVFGLGPINVDPEIFILSFDDLEDFRTWANKQDLCDLIDILKEFEDSELYEHCEVLLFAKERKFNEILDDCGFHD